MKTSTSSNPREHAANIRKNLHLREDVEKVADPKAKALFEVSAEVIDGLQKAFKDYEARNEEAWLK